MMQQAAYTLRNKTVPLSEREQGEDSKRVHFQKGGGGEAGAFTRER